MNRPKNGWFNTVRKDSNSGRIRPIRIKMINGQEVEHHWTDIIQRNIQYPISKRSLMNVYGKHEILGFMDPNDFLKFSSWYDFNNEKPMNNGYTSTEWQKNEISKGNPMDIPILFVNERESKVRGHEGRHRAKASIELGIDKIPVIIRMDDYVPFKEKKYGGIDYDTLNDLVRSDKSVDQMVRDIGNKQGTSLEKLPSFCRYENDNIIMKVSPQTEFKPERDLKIKYRNF